MKQDRTLTDASASSPRELTLRAVLTGAALGALLTPCNVYSGLKIGWSFNMSIAAALLSCGLWGAVYRFGSGRWARPWGLLENNVNQTCASSSASIISAGLVAPIPALTILTGQTLSWPVLSAWLLSVSLLGVMVGLALRRSMIGGQQLPFPSGVAAAETLSDIYAEGGEAARRVHFLFGGGVVAASTKLVSELVWKLPMLGPGVGLGWAGLPSLTTRSLGFVLEPSWLMIGFGAIVGLRVGVSLLLGAVIAWGVLGPWLFASGRLPTPDSDVAVYGVAVEFLLWPGVGLMVAAALTSFALSIGRWILSSESAGGQAASPTASAPVGPAREGVPLRWMAGGFLVAATLAITAQVAIFDIAWPMAVLAVLLTFVLAVVAARVSGETGIPPIGALGKVTQLTFGLIHPASVSVNLMTANVTGGAAGQCSDLLHDLKAGRLLGASVRAQAVAQVLGVLVGSMVGSAAYLTLVPDPATQLFTEEWPAPAVATWKAVAELFRDGLEAAPAGAAAAAVVGTLVGVGLTVLTALTPENRRGWTPSAVSIGLAFVIPAFYGVSMFLGAAAAALAAHYSPGLAKRFTLPIAAGLVAGESLAGVAAALIAPWLGG